VYGWEMFSVYLEYGKSDTNKQPWSNSYQGNNELFFKRVGQLLTATGHTEIT
jgi:integrase